MEYGEVQGPDSGTKKARFICCPLCGWGHKLFKTGAFVIQKKHRLGEPKGWFRFNSGKRDLETAPFVDVRDMSGGRGKSLKRIPQECLTLKEAMNKEEYQDLIQSLKNQISEIQKILENK